DQLAGQAGITAPPMTGTTGEGPERLNAVKALIAGQTFPTDIEGVGKVPLNRQEALQYSIQKPYHEALAEAARARAQATTGQTPNTVLYTDPTSGNTYRVPTG